MKKADIAIGVIVVAAVLFFVLCIPYARTTGLVQRSRILPETLISKLTNWQPRIAHL